eukprot:2435409-Pyramimonas_sp.AAC.2
MGSPHLPAVGLRVVGVLGQEDPGQRLAQLGDPIQVELPAPAVNCPVKRGRPTILDEARRDNDLALRQHRATPPSHGHALRQQLRYSHLSGSSD